MKLHAIITILLFCTHLACYGQSNQANGMLQAVTVDDKALILTKGAYGNIINGQSFQQDALTSYNGWQYIAYYDLEGMCV